MNRRQLVYIDTSGSVTAFYSIIADSFVFLLNHNSLNDICTYSVYPIINVNGTKYVLKFVKLDHNLDKKDHFSLSTTLTEMQKLIDTAEVIKIVDNETLGTGVSLKWNGHDNTIRVVSRLCSKLFTISIRNSDSDDEYKYQLNIDDYFKSTYQDTPMSISSTELQDIYVYELSKLIGR